MLIKAGVDISRLNSEIRKALSSIEGVVNAVEKEELIITSTYEGNHNPGSKHYGNDAVDIRIFRKAKETRDEIARALGEDFYVYLSKTHIHVGYSPGCGV